MLFKTMKQLMYETRRIPFFYEMLSGIYNKIPIALRMPKEYCEVIKILKMTKNEDALIDSVQRELLVRTLKNAITNVPYYRNTVKVFSKEIVKENVFEVLRQFPLLEKDEIMKYPQDFISEKFDKNKLCYVTSGGSTGKGISLWRTAADFMAEDAFIDSMWSKYGYQRTSKVLRIGCDAIVPLDQFPCRIDKNRLLVSPHHLDDKWFGVIVAKMKDFEPDFIHSYPSCAGLLAVYLKENKLKIRPKAVFLASEAILPAQIELCEDVFKAPVSFFYGATEHALLAEGCCKDGKIIYHFNPLYGIAENAQDENGNNELIGTGFWNQAMPLVRYRTQDYSKISTSGIPCKVCGKKGDQIAQLDGRRTNFLVTKSGTLYPGLDRVDGFIWDYVKILRIVQKTAGEIELQIVPRSNFDDAAEMKIVESQIRKFKDWFDLKLVKVDDIPQTNAGKRQFVIVDQKVLDEYNAKHGRE